MVPRLTLALGAVLVCGCAQADPDPGPRTWEVALSVDTDVGAFFSVWGPDEQRMYAVASQEPNPPGPTVGALYRYADRQWRSAPLPPDTPGLNWVFGVGDDRFAVGELGTVLHRVGDDDATPWEVHDCGTNLPLWGVWGAAANDVWAVGGDGFMRPPVLCHFDGAAWTETPLPPLSVMSRALFKVWGTDANNIWAVGHAGLILYYNGTEWTEQPSGTEFDIISLWGTSPDEILAVGGRSDALMVRFDGATWQTQMMPGAPGLNGVWMAPDGTATIVGSMGRLDTVAPGSLEPEPVEPVTNLALHAVFGAPSGRLFAVGGSLDWSPPYTGVVLER